MPVDPLTDDQAKTKAQLLAELKELRQRLKVLESSGPRSDKKRLQPEKTNYGVLAEAANDFIFVIDRDDRVAYVNRYAAEQVGKPPEAIVGQPREMLFPPPIASSQQKNLQKVFRTGQPLKGN